MIAKLIAHAEDRPRALRRLSQAAQEAAVIGLTTNLGFLVELLAKSRVATGHVDTQLVDQLIREMSLQDTTPAAAACAAAMLCASSAQRLGASPWAGVVGPVDRRHLDSEAPFGRILLRQDDRTLEATIVANRGGAIEAVVGECRFIVTLESGSSPLRRGVVNGVFWSGLAIGAVFELVIRGQRVVLLAETAEAEAASNAGNDAISPLPGVVVALLVEVGQFVERGTPIAIVEAMKMENQVCAPNSGFVEAISCSVHDTVEAGQVLAVLRPHEKSAAPTAVAVGAAP
jgi:propionyl-CoA carboxylase alpha chain/3-methylcrotonyl-CoA carboxylase alpha subunit